MNNSFVRSIGSLARSLVSLAGIAAFAAGVSAKPAAAPRPATLQVTVTVPPSLYSFREDLVAEAIGYRVPEALRRVGFVGRAEYVDRMDVSPKADVPVLTINLVRWRIDRIGTFDCTFTASLATPSGTRNLGIFSGTSMPMGFRRDVFARADGFEDAAESALADLARRLDEMNLIPTRADKA